MRVLVFLSWAASGTLSAQPVARSLPTGSTLSESLAGDETRTYRIEVPAGRVAEVSIREEQGIAGIFVLRAPDGKEVARIDPLKRIPAAKVLLIGPGANLVQVTPANHGAMTRVFQFSVSEARPAAKDDASRFSAEQLIGEGERILGGFEPGYLASALANLRAAFELWKQIGDRSRQADTLHHIGSVLHFQGEMKAATEAYQQTLDISAAQHDENGQVAALFGLAFTDYDTAQYAKEAELAEQALEIARRMQDSRGESDALSILGLSFYARGENEKARADFLAMLDAARRAGDRVREADAHNDLGLLEYQLANFPQAEQHYSEALAIFRQESEPVKIAQELNNLAVLFANLGDQRQAISYLEEALPIRKAVAQPGSYANTLYNAGVSYASLGDYQRALDLYNAALPIFRSVSHRVGEAYTLQEQAEAYIWLGEDGKAEQLLKQALAIWRAISNRRGEIQTLLILGNAHRAEHRYSQALAEELEVLSVGEAAGYQREQALAQNNVASILLRTGDTRASLEASAKGLEMSRRIGDRSQESTALRLEGQAWRQLGESKAARKALEDALALQREMGIQPREADTLAELARLDSAEGLLPEAGEHVAEALRLTESALASFGSRQYRMEIASSHRAFYELAIDIAMQSHDTAKAFEISERARARGLVDLITEARLDLREGADPEILARERRIEEALDARQDRLMRLLAINHSAAREAAARREIEELLDQYQAVETEIREKSSQYASLTQPRTLSLSETQALLPESGTVLIEFWLGETRSYAWVVSKKDCRGFALPARATIEEQARRAYAALNARNDDPPAKETLAQREQRLARARAEFLRTAASLSSELLAPLGAGLDAHRLWMVADGALAYLPFAAIPDPVTHGPLVKEHEIVGLPSASVLAALREQIAGRVPAKKMAAVFADPVFSAHDERVVPRGEDRTVASGESGIGDLARLYFTREEADAIRSLAPAGEIRTELDFNANRSAVRDPSLGGYRVIHFATHGMLDSKHPELSGIALSMVDRHGNAQDGFLRLHEIYNLKLNADLVVLSGCQTALGEEVRSEGLIGLARGFMYAGSPQVMASLWSVRDRAVAELMRRFYDRLLSRHMEPAAALRSAQISMLAESRWSDPYDWAAFTIQGSR
jgi:CHAT domain-containing protein